MSERTRIAWTDHTFNPWWGCAKVSPGCNHCYADTLASRYGHDIWGVTKPRRTFGTKHWAEPLKWDRQAEAEGRRHRVFCASMADVFEPHPTAEAERPKLWDLIERTPHLDWQLLTKRPQNVARMVPWGDAIWPGNVWIGTSVEDQQRAEERIPVLLDDVPATNVRFLSCEPLLGPVDLRCFRVPDWVIVGGESGTGYRQMALSWLMGVVEQCASIRLPVFVKQDSGLYSGRQGRIPPDMWALKQFPRSMPL